VQRVDGLCNTHRSDSTGSTDSTHLNYCCSSANDRYEIPATEAEQLRLAIALSMGHGSTAATLAASPLQHQTRASALLEYDSSSRAFRPDRPLQQQQQQQQQQLQHDPFVTRSDDDSALLSAWLRGPTTASTTATAGTTSSSDSSSSAEPSATAAAAAAAAVHRANAASYVRETSLHLAEENARRTSQSVTHGLIASLMDMGNAFMARASGEDVLLPNTNTGTAATAASAGAVSTAAAGDAASTTADSSSTGVLPAAAASNDAGAVSSGAVSTTVQQQQSGNIGDAAASIAVHSSSNSSSSHSATNSSL
jgi:hypothetical protein